MMFAITVTALASLISLIIITHASTLLNTLSFDFRKEAHFSSRKENALEENEKTSDSVEVSSGTYLKSNIYNVKPNSIHYYMCVHIEGMTKEAEDIPFHLKCQVVEKFSDKDFPSIPSSRGISRKLLPLVDSRITPFESPVFQRKILNLQDASPVGLGSGILGIGAVDLGHGLGRFILR